MRWMVSLLLACLLLTPNAWAQSGPAQPKDPPMANDVDIPYQKFVLPNGLTVLVHEDHKAPIVAVNLWYHVGSKNEKPGKTGFAHLFEHLMFGGSEHSKGRYIDALLRVGATDLNGTTSSDRTNYFENVPTSALDYALWMESDRMGYLLGSLDQKTLDLQRGVVQNEKRQGENNPYGQVEELMTKNTYPAGHPYSWTTIGDMADLEAASMKDVQEWFKTYYGPSNVVLVLAGDIDLATAKEKVTKYFGEIPAGPPVSHQQVWIAKMTGGHRQVTQDRVPQARLYKTWNIPEFGSVDADYLDLVSDCLSQGKTSRLYKRLVYDDQIATEVAAYVDLNEIGGQFRIVATARPGQDLAALEKAVDEELARFLKGGPTAEELERVKTQYEANLLRGLERIGGFGGKSDRLAMNQTYLKNPDAYKISLGRVRAATAADLQSAAQRWLSDGVYVLEVHPYPEHEAVATGLDRSKTPEIGPSPELRLPARQRATLSNGLKVILAERHEAPLVSCWMAFDAGYASDALAAPGTASMAMALLSGGTTTRNALEISDQWALLGAQFEAFSNLDLSIARLSALKAKLDPSLELYADVLLHPSYPESDFRRQQAQQLAGIKREESTPMQIARRILPQFLFGAGHPYGNSLSGTGTLESISKMTREDLVRFHDTWFRPNNATLVVVGDTTLAEMMPKLERVFGAWKSAAVPTKEIRPVALASKPVIYLVDKPGSQQSVIVAGTIAPPRANPEEIAIEAMNDGLGGIFTSRLNRNLREEKHWTYGSRSALGGARGERPWIAFAPVQSDKTKDAMAEIQKEVVNLVGNQPLSAEELRDIQAHETLTLPGSRETIKSVGETILELVQYGLPDNYFETYAGKVEALTPNQVNAAARSVLHPESLVWVIVGDRAKIEAPLRELGWGELRLVTPEGKPE